MEFFSARYQRFEQIRLHLLLREDMIILGQILASLPCLTLVLSFFFILEILLVRAVSGCRQEMCFCMEVALEMLWCFGALGDFCIFLLQFCVACGCEICSEDN